MYKPCRGINEGTVEMKIDDICVIKDSNTVRNKLKLCQIVEIYPNREDGGKRVKVMLTVTGGLI